MDTQFHTLVHQHQPPLPPSSSSSSLSLVSTLLDLTRLPAYQEMVGERAKKAEQVENKEKKRGRVAGNLRLVESFIALTRVLVECGCARVASRVVGVEEEVGGVRMQVLEGLRGEVVETALALQHVLEFHEARKQRAGKSAKLREHELRSVFSPTHPPTHPFLSVCFYLSSSIHLSTYKPTHPPTHCPSIGNIPPSSDKTPLRRPSVWKRV